MIEFLSVSFKQDLLLKTQICSCVQAFSPNRFENLINSSDKSQQVSGIWILAYTVQAEKVDAEAHSASLPPCSPLGHKGGLVPSPVWQPPKLRTQKPFEEHRLKVIC